MEELKVPLRESYQAAECNAAGAEAQSLIIDTFADRWRKSASTVKRCLFLLFNTAAFIYRPISKGAIKVNIRENKGLPTGDNICPRRLNVDG